MKEMYIEKDGQQFVQLPAVQYEAILARLEEAEDVLAIREAKASTAETMPAEVLLAVLHGESPVRVFRNHRGWTQAQLAEASGVNRAYLAEIETGKKPGSVTALKALATALNVELDALLRV